jgi:hypothetical protein
MHKRSAEIRSTNYKLKTKVNMKNKTSILVGTRHFFYALLVAVIFCGCEAQKEIDRTQEQKNEANFYTYEYDSCEYVGTKMYWNSSVLVHKGNCKFCAERSKK